MRHVISITKPLSLPASASNPLVKQQQMSLLVAGIQAAIAGFALTQEIIGKFFSQP